MAGITLDDYQLDAVKRMRNGCILCGGVGSGKSRTALTYYYLLNGGHLGYWQSCDGITDGYYPMDDPPLDLYIITTARKRDTMEWESELIPFLLYTDGETRLYTNKVIIDSWNNIQKYSEVNGAFFLFDEQRVVGKGAWAKTFIKIAKANQWILLSATPGDSWSDYIPVFIANGFYKNRAEFLREHVVYKPFRKFYQIDHYVNTGILIRHRNEILVDMDYVKPTESHHEDIYVNYDIGAYKDLTRNRWNPWENKPIENASELCYAMRRVVNTSDSRQIAVLELFEQHPKVIIFYNFDYELEILKQLFEMAFYRVDGKQYDCVVAEWNGHKHEPVPDGNCWVYLVQYTAGAEGWNCTKTDTIIFYSQSYSYKTMVQASGRIDRRNTPYKDLYYYHLKSRSGIDLAISRALVTKKDFNAKKYADRYFER